MEVRYHHQPKRLYRHAVPVVLLSMAILMLATAIFIKYSSLGTPAHKDMRSSLLTPVLQVQPKSNGLAKVQIHHSTTVPVAVKSTLSDDTFKQAGKSAGTSFTVQSSAPVVPAPVVPVKK